MSPVKADQLDLIRDALIHNAKIYINSRYRYENVNQDGFTKEANASTLRTKLGYKTGKFYNLSGTFEVENVAYLGHEDFNSTTNGQTTFPVVADPKSTEVNHAFLTYTGLPDTTLNVGRQPHNFDNQRFIGTVGWRQNDQTYDSAAIISTTLPHTTLIYSYVLNVNRIFGDDHPLGDLDAKTHLINASYTGLPFGKLTAYGYLIDLTDRPVFGLSSKTFGLRFTGKQEIRDGVHLLYTAEYAHQSDYGDNPTDYDANYYHFIGGLQFKGLTTKVGYEVLGQDNSGTVAFQTPLATGHLFNGWADKFLSTPGTGLEDLYISASYKLSGFNRYLDGTKFVLAYHDFSADFGGADYGHEWNALIARDINEHYAIAIKYADYQADEFATDTQKFWFQAQVKY